MLTVIARWESKGGKDWVELCRDDTGYGYRSPSAGGYLGPSLEDAMRVMEQRTAAGASYFCSQKSAMTRVRLCSACGTPIRTTILRQCPECVDSLAGL